MAKKIVIVGAGYAGVEAALRLNRLGRRDGIGILLIDRNPYHTLLTEVHEVAGHRQDEECMRIPLADIFRDTRVEIACDEITGFDFDKKMLTGKEGRYPYDYCILAFGSSPAFYGIPGLEQNVLTLWSLKDAVKIREHVEGCFERARKEKDAAERRRLLTFVVAGAGFTGVEMAGELARWLTPLCREHRVDRKDVRLILLDMLRRVLPVLDEKNSARAHRYLTKKLGVEVMLETLISSMQPGRAVTSRGVLETRTMIWCAGICCNKDAEAADVDRVDGSKRIKVDECCRTGRAGVYAVGDCGALAGPDGKPYPAMVENALQSACGAANNILRDIRGQRQTPVGVKFHGIMVSIGNFYTVSDIMGRRLPPWLSLLMKYLVNAHYLFGIMGLRGPAKYLHDEVLNRRQDKFFLEKHYTQRMQAWWLMPLRMFLGAYWVYEAIDKITLGWLGGPKLAEYLGRGFSRGYQLADAVSSATGGGTVIRTDNVVDINVNIVQLIFGNASKLVQGNAVTSDIFAKVNALHFGSFNFVPWLINSWVLSARGWEMFFQIAIVLGEVVVGLMLLGGAFTFVASAASLALLCLFLTSTGLYLNTWWMAFAAIACMGGAGRAFGMDYYLSPWYARVWEYWWKNRGIRLFFHEKKT